MFVSEEDYELCLSTEGKNVYIKEFVPGEVEHGHILPWASWPMSLSTDEVGISSNAKSGPHTMRCPLVTSSQHQQRDVWSTHICVNPATM